MSKKKKPKTASQILMFEDKGPEKQSPPPRQQRVDFSQIFALDARSLPVTHTGYLELDARVSRIGIMQYRDGDGKLFNELKPPEELFSRKAMESLRYAAATDKHPKEIFVTPENWKKLAIGFAPAPGKPDQSFYLRAKIVITEKDIITRLKKKFEAGETQQVSAGYSAEIDKTGGSYNGEKYDSCQKNIVYNHIALVDVGRAGPEVKLVFNSRDSEKIRMDGIATEFVWQSGQDKRLVLK